MVVIILVLNAVVLLAGIFNVPLLIFAAIQIPVAGLLIGGLFLPRMHLIDKFGQKIAGVGVGGILLLLVLGVIRGVLRAQRRRARSGEELDLSWMTDPSALGAMAGSLVVFLMFAALFVFLWKLVGIVRVLAGCYVAELSFMSLGLIIGGLINAHREAEIDEFHQQAMQKHDEMMERMHQRMNQPIGSDPGFESQHMRSRSQPSQPPTERFSGNVDPETIRLTIINTSGGDSKELLQKVLTAIGNPEYETVSTTPIRSMVRIESSADPKELAKKIDFARSVSANGIGRIITAVF